MQVVQLVVSQAKRYPSTKILKTVSSAVRLQALTLLYEKGPQGYTDIMNSLKMNPSRDAGRFAYHLKALIRADLIEPDTDTKKYKITEFGRFVLGLTEEIERQSQKKRRMLVRTSKLSIEEFDRNKIINSLIKEAGVPTELAQKIARETENRLKQFQTRYLTAPLIREIVNTILVEKGLEEYRHKLTRVGLPIHDVTQLVEAVSQKQQNIDAVRSKAGDAVIEEYTLLNILPRDIADAQISGALHINSLGCWMLKPQKIMHDLRFFLKNGVRARQAKPYATVLPPPKNLASALSTLIETAKAASNEFSEQQAFDYFNVFLAPYAKGLSREKLKDELQLFLSCVSQDLVKNGEPVKISLGLETSMPAFLATKEAVVPDSQLRVTYGDFADESRLVATVFLEALLETSQNRPVFNPSITVKMRTETLKDARAEACLFLAHQLAAQRGLPFFANMCKTSQMHASYDAAGFRLGAEWRKDWELDTMRAGCLDSLLVNLPRVAYTADGNQSKFFELLAEQLEMATRALEIKHQVIKHHVRAGALPFAAQTVNGESYLRHENMVRVVSFVGLNEAVQSLLKQPLFENEKTLSFAEKIVGYIQQSAQKNSKKPETRVASAMVPNAAAARRLAELDVERYGLGRVQVQGSRESPCYTDLTAVPLNVEMSFEERIRVEGKFHPLCVGGHLAVLELPDKETTPDDLFATTRHIADNSNIGFYTFSRELAYCSQCNHVSHGSPNKCPSCGSVSTLTCFKRGTAA